MSRLRFIYEETEAGALLRHKPPLLGKKLFPERWLTEADAAQATTLGRLILIAETSEVEQPPVRFKTDHLFLSHAAIAGLSKADAKHLDLPGDTRFALRLEARDNVMSDRFFLGVRWVQGGGVGVATQTNGAFIHQGGKTYRIPEPTFSIYRSANALTEPLPEAERHLRYAALKETIETQVDENVEIDDYLTAVTIYHASAFSLKLGVNVDDFDFDPVLFGRDVAKEAGEDQVSEETFALLPPKLQDLFAKDRFRRFTQARPAYPLEKGSFVIIDPALRETFQAVREVSSADSVTRRAFVSNPTGYLREKLGEEKAFDLDDLFIETEEFSKRITGIDIWRKQVLPYVKPVPNSWVPETFGLRVGEDDYVEVSPTYLPELNQGLQAAIIAGEPSFVFNGAQIPVSQQTQEAVADLNDLHTALVADGVEDKLTPNRSEAPEVLANKRFLTVKTNFDDVSFGLFDATRKPEQTLPAQQPDALTTRLMDYQLFGFQWFVEVCLWNFPGVLLADDMGLGKTLQTLSFLAWRSHQHPGPTLIVAPTGLLANWKAEIEKHLKPGVLGELVEAYGKNLQTFRVHETQATDTQIGQSSLDLEDWKNSGVVLTTYETMRDYHISFARLRFSTIVFDEIQKLKNPASQLTRSAQTLNGNFKIGLTGTPVENRLMDIWSIMDVLWPGRLGSSRSFHITYPGDDLNKLRSLHSELFVRSQDKPPVGLRRMKADQLDDLPAKSEHALEVEMPPSQADAYQNIVARAFRARDAYAPGDGMLRTLHQLRNTSLHPHRPETGYGDMLAYVQASARLSKTVELLDEIKDRDEKVLIFVESLEMQAFVADFIAQRFELRSKPERIHGQVPGPKRQKIVDAFQNRDPGFDVLILSPKAGGVGLTLTAANHVIHLSRWWNPAVEDQSTDRLFRIGQTKPVHVYYPMAVHPSAALRQHSFDLKLNSLLTSKRQLSADTLLPPENRDSDSLSLFNGVTVDPDATGTAVTVEAQQAPEPSLSEAGPVQPPLGSASEPSLEAPVPAKPPLQPSMPEGTRHFIFEEGDAPNLDAVFWGLEGVRVQEIHLIDPYAYWTLEGQKGLAAISAAIAEYASKVGMVRVTMLPPRQVKNPQFETEKQGFTSLRDVFNGRFSTSGIQPPKIIYKTRFKTRKDDFHDRYIVVTYAIEGTRRERTYAVPRGLDAFYRHHMRLEIFISDDKPV